MMISLYIKQEDIYPIRKLHKKRIIVAIRSNGQNLFKLTFDSIIMAPKILKAKTSNFKLTWQHNYIVLQIIFFFHFVSIKGTVLNIFSLKSNTILVKN